jgi:putative aldouronate transport system substrate-binding protein
VLFDPGDPEYVKTTYADEQAIVPHLIADPTQSLYSATDTSMGGQLTQRFADGLGEIVRGQVPLNNLDRIIADWRSAGGDQMRSEYQQAYAELMR